MTDITLADALTRLVTEHPSDKVREAARLALDGYQSASEFERAWVAKHVPVQPSWFEWDA